MAQKYIIHEVVEPSQTQLVATLVKGHYLELKFRNGETCRFRYWWSMHNPSWTNVYIFGGELEEYKFHKHVKAKLWLKSDGTVWLGASTSKLRWTTYLRGWRENKE